MKTAKDIREDEVEGVVIVAEPEVSRRVAVHRRFFDTFKLRNCIILCFQKDNSKH